MLTKTLFNFRKFSTITLLSLGYAVSPDCPNVVQFALDAGIKTGQSAIWNTLNTDCCSSGFITCVGQFVTEIKFFMLSLNGFINGTAIPAGVTYLDLHGNNLNGSIPSSLPSGLTWLGLSNNQLTGNIPFLPVNITFLALNNNFLTGNIPSILPNRLLDIYVYGNFLSGDLPPFPSSLKYLDLGYPGFPGNHFTGTLMLNAPVQLYITYNWITDIIIQNVYGFSGNCDLSYNPLLGNPNIIGMECGKSGLYSASLLPHTITSAIKSFSIGPSSSNSLISATSTPFSVKFVQILTSAESVANLFNILHHNLTLDELIKMILKLGIDAIIMITVFTKSPFRREWKVKVAKWRGDPKTNNLLLSP